MNGAKIGESIGFSILSQPTYGTIMGSDMHV